MPKQALSPEELLSLLLNKDEQGFNYLYDNYSAALYGIIIRILGNEDEAAEALQDIFLKIWNSVQSYRSDRGSLYTWMLNIARNTALDVLKSKRYRNAQQNQTLPEIVHEHDGLSVEQQHEFGELQKVVNSLRDEYRVVIEKAYFSGYTQQEIADELNVPLGTVKTRTRSAMQQLKDLLHELKFLLLFIFIR